MKHQKGIRERMDEPMMTSKEYAYREKLLDQYRQQAEMQYDAMMLSEKFAREGKVWERNRMRAIAKNHEVAMTALATCLNDRDRMALPTIRKEARDEYEARVANYDTHYIE